MVSDTLYTQAQVTLLADKFFSAKASKIAGAIAMAETNTVIGNKQYCDFDKVGDKNLVTDVWGPSFSAWQIRSLKADKGTGRQRDELELVKPDFAAKAAYEIYKARGYRWSDWSTYNNGSHLAFLMDSPEAQVPEGMVRVQAGDTLTRIGNRTGYPWRDIAKVNNMKDPYTIGLGRVLKLPDFPHVVVPRETWESIAEKYGTDLTAFRLQTYNKTAAAKPTVGVTIKIPRLN